MTWICTLGSALVGEWVWWLYLLVRLLYAYTSQLKKQRFLDLGRTSYSIPSVRCWACSFLVSSAPKHRQARNNRPRKMSGRKGSRGNRQNCGHGWRKGISGYSSGSLANDFTSMRRKAQIPAIMMTALRHPLGPCPPTP